MKRSRRGFLRLAAGGVTLPALCRSVLALDYPTRPIHWIIGFPPGGGADHRSQDNGKLVVAAFGSTNHY
jgi:tripartite-type tricarboxylate transporter receptor subunit TctC